jgi:hypothetical protein
VTVLALIALTLVAASVLLVGLWYLLQWVTALPRWVRRSLLALE